MLRCATLRVADPFGAACLSFPPHLPLSLLTLTLTLTLSPHHNPPTRWQGGDDDDDLDDDGGRPERTWQHISSHCRKLGLHNEAAHYRVLGERDARAAGAAAKAAVAAAKAKADADGDDDGEDDGDDAVGTVPAAASARALLVSRLRRDHEREVRDARTLVSELKERVRKAVHDALSRADKDSAAAAVKARCVPSMPCASRLASCVLRVACCVSVCLCVCLCVCVSVCRVHTRREGKERKADEARRVRSTEARVITNHHTQLNSSELN